MKQKLQLDGCFHCGKVPFPLMREHFEILSRLRETAPKVVAKAYRTLQSEPLVLLSFFYIYIQPSKTSSPPERFGPRFDLQ
jgi:hypothetical protein